MQYPWVPYRNNKPSREFVELSSLPLDRDENWEPQTAIEVGRDNTYVRRMRELSQKLLTCTTERDVVKTALTCLLTLGYPRVRYYKYTT